MSEESRESKIEPISDDAVVRLVRDVVKAHHEGLGEAAIELFWIKAAPMTAWGAIAVATEVLWWLSAADVVLKINRQLWESLSEDGRRGLIDHFLSQAQAKEGGVTTMSTSKGERQLYELVKPSLSVHPHVIARNPGLLAEIGELKKLQQAIMEPDQFLLDFESADGGEGSEEEDEEAAPRKRLRRVG